MKLKACHITLLIGLIYVLPVRGQPDDLARAEAYFQKDAYARALPYYERLNKPRPEHAVRHMAVCYWKTGGWQEAKYWLQQLHGLRKVADTNTFLYARLLKFMGEYQKSKELFEQYFQRYHKPDQKQFWLASCDSARKWKRSLAGFQVSNVTQLNSRYSEFGPVFYKDGLVFSSSRPEVLVERKHGRDGAYFYDLYRANKQKGGGWQKPRPMSLDLNTPGHEGPTCFHKDGQVIYFTRSGKYKGEQDQERGHDRLKMYKARNKMIGWSRPRRFRLNDSLASFGHPCITEDGRIFFFVSDMKGGYGGTDIYAAFRVDSSWTNAVNLGPKVNTRGNEILPFYHADGTLYFASNGHLGMGGYDIYCAKEKNGVWQKVTNMKPPINSSYNDLGLILNKSTQKGFMVSDRPGGLGEEDIYRVEKTAKRAPR